MTALHRSLDGDEDAPYPASLWMANLCEHFPGRLPSEILNEIARLPVGMLDEILEAKVYRQVKETIDAADTAEAVARLPQSPMFLLVREIDLEIAAEELERRRASG